MEEIKKIAVMNIVMGVGVFFIGIKFFRFILILWNLHLIHSCSCGRFSGNGFGYWEM